MDGVETTHVDGLASLMTLTFQEFEDVSSRERAASQGFRLQAPSRGRKRPGVGKVRNVVERCHNFLAQFGRVGRRLDRSPRTDLGWCQLAACVSFIRSGFVR